MLLYNITIGIDKDIEPEWLLWIQGTFIPAVMDTELFASSKFYKILHDNEDGTISYCIQFFAPTIEHVQQYLDRHAQSIIEKHRTKFLNKHVVFQTLLEEIR